MTTADLIAAENAAYDAWVEHGRLSGDASNYRSRQRTGFIAGYRAAAPLSRPVVDEGAVRCAIEENLTIEQVYTGGELEDRILGIHEAARAILALVGGEGTGEVAPHQPGKCRLDGQCCYVGAGTDDAHWRCGTYSCGKASPAPTTPPAEGEREAIARIIDPDAWAWKPLPRDPNEGLASKVAYDHQDRHDTAANDRRKQYTLAKADAILSRRAAPHQPPWPGEEELEWGARAFCRACPRDPTSVELISAMRVAISAMRGEG